MEIRPAVFLLIVIEVRIKKISLNLIFMFAIIKSLLNSPEFCFRKYSSVQQINSKNENINKLFYALNFLVILIKFHFSF